MASLISSIFGEKKQQSSSSDLFAKVSIPTIHPKNKASPSKEKKDEEKEEADQSDNSNSKSLDANVVSSSEQPTKKEESSADKEKREEEEKRTIFVGNLPADITRRALAGIFKPCGDVASSRLRSVAVSGVKLPPDQAGNQKLMRQVCANTGKLLADAPKKCAQGYVVFKSIDSVEKALKLNNTTYQSHTIRVDHASPTIEPGHSVFVGNLPYGADEETLRQHFAEKLSEGDLNEDEGAAISGVRIIRDNETQKCKGFGYVLLRDASLVPIALQLHESKYMKRELRVMVCGKRFKGKRGSNAKSTLSGYDRRSFEGQRATSSTTKSSSSKKRKTDSTESSPHNSSGGKAKKRRARSEKKAPSGKAGMSKRATTEQKVNKRVKKLQKRAQKGMGKTKK